MGRIVVTILSKVVQEERLVVTTDYANRPIFNYHIDKFNNDVALLAEIKRSISGEVARVSRRSQRLIDLEVEVSA